MNSIPANQSIESIIRQMDQVIERCIKEKSKLGYFAVLYRDVTVEVNRKIKAGFFDDGSRMERLDVVFATRYLDAIQKHWQGGKPSKSWMVAFNETKHDSHIILQHLLLGMNAHINLDLAIATAHVAPGSSLSAIQNDFNKIMTLLSDMIDDVQNRIEKVSPTFAVIDKLGGRTDERIAGFSINKARDLAWKTAASLARESTATLNKNIIVNDKLVALIGSGLARPGLTLTTCLQMIHLTESRDVVKVIKTLKLHK